MKIIDSEKLSRWESSPKEYITEGINDLTRRYLEYCEDKFLLEISYQDRRGTSEKRTISPKRVFKHFDTGRYYLEAYCNLRKEIRVLDLRRISIYNASNERSDVESTGNSAKDNKTIFCIFREIETTNDDGFYVDSVEAECENCGNKTWSFGTSLESKKRCLALMQESCVSSDSNWYVERK